MPRIRKLEFVEPKVCPSCRKSISNMPKAQVLCWPCYNKKFGDRDTLKIYERSK